MTCPSVFEKLQATNPNAEIWWDSSPLVYGSWKAKQLNSAPDQKTQTLWSAQLTRFFNSDNPDKSLVRGITTNPSLIAKSVIDNPEYWSERVQILLRNQCHRDSNAVYWIIYQDAVARAAEVMLPMWHATNGKFGWVSGQLDPRYIYDVDRMMEQALQLSRLSPNIMVKVPGSQQGYEVIRRLVARGISINNTLSFTVPQFVACMEAVKKGKALAQAEGVSLTNFRSVITHMIGRFGTQGDLKEEAAVRKITLSPSDIRWAEIAILKRTYRLMDEKDNSLKMLLSSLLVDPPRADKTSISMHLQETAGGNFAYTCKPEFISEVMERQSGFGGFDASAIDRDVPKDVMTKLYQLPYFRKSYELDGIQSEDFARQPAFVTTSAEVNSWTRRMIDFVARQIEIFPGVLERPTLIAAE
jgi:transaldolase